MREFINFNKGSMSVQLYSLKFTQLSEYATTLVEDSRSRFISSRLECPTS